MIGIYETIRAHNNKIFNFNAHYKRLLQGAQFSKLKLPISKSNLIKLIHQELQTTKKQNSRIRITLTYTSFTIESNKIIPSNSNKLITVKAQRPIPHIKNNNRIIEDKALEIAKSQYAVDALLINKNSEISEGLISNFFIIKNETLITPEKNILLGTTRELVLKIAKQNKIPIQLRNIKISELTEIDGAFITNSIKQIVPIYQIDSIIIPKSNITTTTQKAFKELQKDTSIWT